LPGRRHWSSGGASATPVGGPPLATTSGTVVAADSGLEMVHRFLLCGMSDVWANSLACHPRTTLHGAATWRIQCYDSTAMCHTAGFCRQANSMACHPRATYHIAGCCHLVNSLSRFQSHIAGCGGFRILSDTYVISVMGYQPANFTVNCCTDCQIVTKHAGAGFPRLLESPGFFSSRTWKVLENHFGPGN